MYAIDKRDWQADHPEMSGRSQPDRYHAMDALRAAMMLLGIFLHASLAYTTLPNGRYKDASTHVSLDVLVVFIHTFRMPVFFMLAGFFGSRLYERRGLGGMAKNRLKRILIPLLAAWIIVSPLTHAGYVFARAVKESASLASGLAAIHRMDMLKPGEIYHLWFLCDLLLFYPLILGLNWAIRRIGPERRNGLSSFFRRVLQSPWRLGVLFVLTLLALVPAPLAPIGHLSVKQALLLQAAPFLFFAFGWLLYLHTDLLPTFRRRPWWKIGLALPLVPLSYVATRQTLAAGAGEGTLAHLVASSADGAIVCLLMFGLTGVFLRYLDRPLGWVRYLSDASYWLYLVHYPLVLWIAGTLAATNLHAWIKLLATLGTAVPILLLTYHYGVRFTTVGTVLQGRKFALCRLDSSAAVPSENQP